MIERKLGEDCGYEWCNTDHSDEGRYSVFMGHHTDDCLIYLPSGNCTCGRKEASWQKQHGDRKPPEIELEIELERRIELAEQDRIWKEKRMVSGHGAQDGSARDPDYKALMVFIGGPIKHWWDENWMSPEHIRYDEWRTKIEEACIAAGFLVYKPYTAWKGTWNEEAQPVNNAVIRVVDIFINLTPPGVPSDGTRDEIEEAKEVGTSVINFPPGLSTRDEADIENLISYLTQLADIKNGKVKV